MKRRLTLVTVEESIPGDDRDIPIITADDNIADLLAEEEDEVMPEAVSPMSFEEMEALYKPKRAEEQTEQPPGASDANKNVDDDEEELMSEESDIEYSEDEEYDEEASDVDDSDLLKRLEEKYGKLPSTQPPDDDDYDNDDEADADDDDIDPTWTSN